LHAHRPVHLRASLWLGAILGSIALSWAFAATSHAEAPVEGDPNDYQCTGHISVGAPEVGSTEQQVRYTFSCDGAITGYQLQAQIPLTGFAAAPLVSSQANDALTDSFSCGGEVPGFAVNCVGATKLGLETITGQFAIGAKLCAEPRVDPVLTVTDIYLEKGVPTQAISGPFDLGRPLHCPADSYKGGTRLDPVTPRTKGNRHGKAKGKGKTKGKTKQTEAKK
jgi:hypothetical protein